MGSGVDWDIGHWCCWGTDWVQVLTGTLPGSGAGWATRGTGADGVTVAGIQRGPLHAAACRGLTLLQVSRVSDWCTQLHAEASPRRGHGGPVASLGVRLRVREATSSQVSELLIPPCLIRCH